MFPSKYFKRQEFACKCGCGKDTVDAELLAVLDDVRDHFGEPVTITSGCRCRAYNSRIGGKPGSKHIDGKAADIVVKNVSAYEVWEYLNERYFDRYGLGRYKSFTHVDVRPNKARWGD